MSQIKGVSGLSGLFGFGLLFGLAPAAALGQPLDRAVTGIKFSPGSRPGLYDIEAEVVVDGGATETRVDVSTIVSGHIERGQGAGGGAGGLLDERVIVLELNVPDCAEPDACPNRIACGDPALADDKFLRGATLCGGRDGRCVCIGGYQVLWDDLLLVLDDRVTVILAEAPGSVPEVEATNDSLTVRFVEPQPIPIDLGDIVGGGDGTGTASPAVMGINPDSGHLDLGFTDGPIDAGDGMAFQPVADETSPFIDSVFLIELEAMPINSAGVTFMFPPEDVLRPSMTWGQILNNRIGGELTRPISIGGMVFNRGVGIHAAAGITYDLDEIRNRHGQNAAKRVAAFAGMGDSAFTPDPGTAGFVTTYLILSNDAEILDFAFHRASTDDAALRGMLLCLPIPAGAKYLTLATGAGNGNFYYNAGTFGDAVVSGEANCHCPPEGDTHCTGLTIDPPGGRPGVYTVMATAADDSLDTILYTFSATNGVDVVTMGPQAENTATFTLTAGQWTIWARVDDDTECLAEAPDAACAAIQVVVIEAPPQNRFMRGDCNGDGQYRGTVTDEIYSLNFKFLGGERPRCLAACDVDGDGDYIGTLTDEIYSLNFEFLGGRRPPAPFPGCGYDQSALKLGCESSPCPAYVPYAPVFGLMMVAFEGAITGMDEANPEIVAAMQKALSDPCNPNALSAMTNVFQRYRSLSPEERNSLVGPILAEAVASDPLPLDLVRDVLSPDPATPIVDPENSEQLPDDAVRDEPVPEGFVDLPRGSSEPSERGCSPDFPMEGEGGGASQLYSIDYKGFHTRCARDHWGSGDAEPYFILQMFRVVGTVEFCFPFIGCRTVPNINTWQRFTGVYGRDDDPDGDVDNGENRYGRAGRRLIGVAPEILLDSDGTPFNNPTTITAIGWESDGCGDLEESLASLQVKANTIAWAAELSGPEGGGVAAAASLIGSAAGVLRWLCRLDDDDYIGSAYTDPPIDLAYAENHVGVRGSCDGCDPPYDPLFLHLSDFRLHLNDGCGDGHYDLYFDVHPWTH